MKDGMGKYDGAYILDTNIFRSFYNFYYRDVFPELWDGFDRLLQQNKICSVSEVKIEYDRQLSHLPEAVSWAKDNAKLFLPLDRDGAVALQKIYSYPEYRLTEKDIAKQKTNADAFLVAMAVSIHGCVVTNESANKLNSTRIPNICNRFNVSCINLHDFLLILKDESRK